MANLSENQKSFIRLMTKSDEHARRGFELLGKRDDPHAYFDAIAEAGLFAAERNPAPIPVEPNAVRVPYWSALDYLLACAKIADVTEDFELASKVVAVVRSVTVFREADGKVRDNYHTFRKFAEILGVVPPAVVTEADMDMVGSWLSSRFDRDTVAHALDTGPIARFLQSERPEDWVKATRILRYCLAIEWRVEEGRGDEETPVSIVDAYWLKELVNHHAAAFGRRARGEGVAVFRDALERLYSKGSRSSWSYLHRPAIEDHGQNFSWRSVDNAFVEGLRDALGGWCEVEPDVAEPFLADLLHSDAEILRRVGLHAVDTRWDLYAHLYASVLAPELFRPGHLHELYNLMRHHFEEFDEPAKAATIDAIRHLPLPDGEDGEERLRQIQRRWLEATRGTTYLRAAAWLAELSAGPNAGVSEHADFNAYMEVRSGPGPGPYEAQELIAFAEDGTIAQRLNGFEPQQRWRGPTREALVESLEQAVMTAPLTFARALPRLVDAGVAYRYGTVSGFKRLWDAGQKEENAAEWDQIWPRLFGFFEAIVRGEPLEPMPGDAFRYTDSWVVSSIADTLHAATRDDARAYPPALLARGWALLDTMSERAEAVQTADEGDPMTQAINSPKGRVLEAVFSHVLRECRLSDKEQGSHSDAWAARRPLFDRELAKCEDDNFEFSTLLGAYLANMEYVDGQWTRDSIRRIFPPDRLANFVCALGGLAYSAATRGTYRLLRDVGIIEEALRLELRGREIRKKLIERIVLAYLWGEETIESARVAYLFRSSGAGDLEAATWFLWTIRGSDLDRDQLEKVVRFWDRVVVWAREQPTPPSDLLASLGTLAWAIDNVEGRNRELLLAVAPYVGIGHGTHEFLEQLRRLVEISPEGVSAVLGKLVQTYQPTYDYEGIMKSLVGRLADLGQRRAALEYCERLRDVDGMAELFVKLREQPAR